VEQIGDVQTVAPGEVEGKPAGLADLVGRLHPALVHFPIAWLVGLALVDFVGLVRKREAWQRAGIFVLAGTVLSLLPTAATGLLRAAHMEFDANLRALLVVHRTLNLVVAGLLLVAFGAPARAPQSPARVVARCLLWSLVFAATGAGPGGGRLRRSHGVRP
jgi:uncharacterized membrane protein